MVNTAYRSLGASTTSNPFRLQVRSYDVNSDSVSYRSFNIRTIAKMMLASYCPPTKPNKFLLKLERHRVVMHFQQLTQPISI